MPAFIIILQSLILFAYFPFLPRIFDKNRLAGFFFFFVGAHVLTRNALSRSHICWARDATWSWCSNKEIVVNSIGEIVGKNQLYKSTPWSSVSASIWWRRWNWYFTQNKRRTSCNRRKRRDRIDLYFFRLPVGLTTSLLHSCRCRVKHKAVNMSLRCSSTKKTK